jgi:Holliday junction resolvase RusA-like endonuclease
MTPRTVTLRVIGIPQPKGSTRAFLPKGSTRPIVTTDNPGIREWQRAIVAVAQTLNEPPFEGAVAVALLFRFPRPKSKPRRIVHHVTRPDLDKCVRCVGDALQGVLFADDAAIVALHARKQYAPEGTAPGVEIEIHDLPAIDVTAKPGELLALLDTAFDVQMER